MYTKWTANCKTEQEKAQLEVDIRRAKPVLDRLKDILEQDYKTIRARNVSEKSFESPSWPFMQAFSVGIEAELQDVIKLIDLDKQKDTTNE